MSKKLSVNYIDNILTNKNIKWINKEEGYKNNNSKLKLQCLNPSCNYIWYGPFRSIKISKYGCHKCAGKAKYSISQVKETLLNRNITLISNTYKSNIIPLELKCKICNHEWKNSFNNLNGRKNKNQGCPKCAGLISPSNEDILTLLMSKNIIWLNKVDGYKNQKTKMKLKCNKCGHIWIASYLSIKNQDSGCPKCAQCLKHDIKFVKNFCKQKNINVLSSEYKNAHDKLQLKCHKCDYIWYANFAHIKNRNSGCPNCASCKTEILCRKYLENKLKLQFPKCSPPWLKGLELDGYNNKYKIAFEYNGEQHYKFTPYFHKKLSDFEWQQIRDQLKRFLLKQERIKLIDIPYTYNCQKEKDLYKFIDSELIRLKIIDRQESPARPSKKY